jgi:hypothetical protein
VLFLRQTGDPDHVTNVIVIGMLLGSANACSLTVLLLLFATRVTKPLPLNRRLSEPPSYEIVPIADDILFAIGFDS